MCLAVGLLLAGTPTAARGVPPKVVETVPANNATDVDPALKEIRVTFDQDMSRAGFSVCTGTQSPKIVGRPRWRGMRVVVVRVKLEPQRTYSLSINCASAKKFRSAAGEPAVPYPITFTTGNARSVGKDGKLSVEDNREAIKELRQAIDEDYSYRDLRNVDWDKLFADYGRALEKARSARSFAKTAARLLAKAKDIHIWLKVDDETIGSYKRRVRPNYNPVSVAKVVPGFRKRNRCVSTGRFDDGIGYILITSWSTECGEHLEAAFEALGEFADGKGLIVDVRPNSGGAEPLAQKFAGCFADKAVVYAKHVYRSVNEPGGFSKPSERVLEPTKDRPTYRGKVAVLTGPAIMSSCEAFLLMMKQVPGCTLVGQRSYGSSGNPQPYDLGNGVTVYLPSWQAMRPDGTCFEGEGIAPDVEVKTTSKKLLTADPVIEAALKILRQG